MISAKNFRKLNEFVSKHQSLKAQFDGSQTTQGKFRVLKHTINLLNPHSVKSVSIKNSMKNDCNQLAQQSEEIYFRQLNKMCEGQQQFQLNKIEEINKKQRVTKEDQLLKDEKKQIKSTHAQRKNINYFKSKLQQIDNQNDRKFLVLPNFTEILKGCSVAYAGISSQVLLKRKMKTFKQNITKMRGKYKTNQNQRSMHKDENKTSYLREQVKELKKKAKNEYNLDFEDFNFEKGSQNASFGKQNKGKIKSQSLTFFRSCQNKKKYNKPQKQKKQTRIQEGDQNQLAKKQQSFYIPSQFMKTKNKFRPSTVGTNIFRYRKSQDEKFNYFRV